MKVDAASPAAARFQNIAEVMVEEPEAVVRAPVIVQPAGTVSAWAPSRLTTCATRRSPATVVPGGVRVGELTPVAEVAPRAAMPARPRRSG